MEGAAAALGKALGLTLAEARIRLAPEPPAILASLAPEPAAALVAALRQAGLPVTAVEAGPSDGQRVVARTAVFSQTGAVFQARAGAPVELPWSDVITILRGASSVRSEMESTQKSTKFSVATALITQGLKTSRTVEKTVRSQQEDTEQVTLLHGRGGQRVVLRERELDFSCLGAAMQPTRMANMVALARLLKERAPSAFYDERLLRLGRRPLPMFVGGETREQSGNTVQTRIDSSGGLEILAEILSRAVEEGLLP
jgi:hypothetical protein